MRQLKGASFREDRQARNDSTRLGHGYQRASRFHAAASMEPRLPCLQAHLRKVQERLEACHEVLLPGIASAGAADVHKAAVTLSTDLQLLEVHLC